MDIKFGGLSGLTFMLAAQVMYAQKVVSPAFHAITAPNSPVMRQMEQQARPMDMIQAISNGQTIKAAKMPQDLRRMRRMLESAASQPAPADQFARTIDRAADTLRAHMPKDSQRLQASADVMLRQALESETARALELENRLAHADIIIQKLLNGQAH
jgi:hypothetical protein